MPKQFLLRFVIGGLIVACIPIIAEKIGGKIAGLVIVFPTLIILSFLAIGQGRGSQLVHQASAGALWGLPALAVFLIAMYLLSGSMRQSYLVWIGCSVLCWIITATVIFYLEK